MRNQLRSVFLVLFVAVVLGVVAMPAFADPPGVAARLSFMQGPVSMQPGGVDDWVDATLNRPMTTSDRLWADQNARAEISMGNVKARIDQQTSLTISNLDDQITQLELDQGTLFVHVRRLFQGESVEIDTPNVAFVVNDEGDYRFDVDPNADTTYVSVRRGQGQGTGESDGVTVSAGQQVVFSGGNSGQNQTAELGDPDEFDQWNMQRDRRQDHSQSARYVSPGMVGYDDLDEYGSWSQDPQYGPVWRPQVSAGWAPYRQGHWAWIDPWGYTWVDDAPWGFAPFHYGRWVSIGGGWGWCPGRPEVYRPGAAYVRPVYAPALVAFIGGSNWGVSIGIGGGGGGGPVGWVPLSYGEPYYPSYRVSPNYVRNVNVTNTHITNITNVTNNYTVINNNNTTVINNNNGGGQPYTYRNARVAGAVTAVPANAMASGRPVQQAAVKIDERQIQQAKFSTAPQVAPTREAVLGGRTPAKKYVPPPSAVNRPVMSKTPPPPPPAKFEAKQQLLQKNDGRPLDAAQVKDLPKAQRPEIMQAGKPRPPQAVQQIKASAPAKAAGQPAPTVRPPAAKPAPGGPANAGKSGAAPVATPGKPANGPGPERNTAPDHSGQPTQPTGAGAPPNRPNTQPADNKGAPGGNPNKPGAERNVPHPPSATPSRPNEPATPAEKPVTHPPARENTPNTPAARPATPPASASRPSGATERDTNTPHPPDRTANPPARTAPDTHGAAQPPARTAPESHTATPPPSRSAPESHSAAPPARPSSQPPARETSAPHPPEHQAGPPQQHTAPPPAKPAKENKDNKKDSKDNNDKQPK